MLNGSWLNGAPLNGLGLTQRTVLLAVNATAGASISAPGLRVRRQLAANATASATIDPPGLVRRRCLAVDATAGASTVGEMSVEIGGVVHAYLSVNATAGASIAPLHLTVLRRMSVDASAGAQVEATLYRKIKLGAIAEVSAVVEPPPLHAFVNLGALPPGSDSLVGTQRIRAFAFCTANLIRRRGLGVNATAGATIAPPVLRRRLFLAVNARAGTGVSTGDEPGIPLYVKRMLAVNATAGAQIEPPLLFRYRRMAVNATAGATVSVELFMNIFDKAPTERTVYVRFAPRVVVLPPPRRTTNA